MFSRLALTTGVSPKPNSLIVLARATHTTPALKNEERDLVNFPRRKRPVNSPKVRMGFLPDEWFTAFYSKTGVTGPYMLGVGLATFLISKEIYVLEHEFYNGLSLAMVLTIMIKKLGPGIGASLDKEVAAVDASWSSLRDGNIVAYKDAIKAEEKSQVEAEGGKLIFPAKKENIDIQLETAYRERLVQVHSEVKKKLDYQLEITNVKNRVEQKHMVDWIVNSVKSSITPAQEAAAMKKCLADLKALAATA